MEVKQTWKTSDGKDHESKAAAARWQKQIEVEEERDQVLEKWKKVVLQNKKTLDGEPVVLGEDYWRIRLGWGGDLSRIEEVSLAWYSCKLRMDRGDVVVMIRDEGLRETQIRVEDLYRHKQNAESTVRYMQVKELQELMRRHGITVDDLYEESTT